MKSSNSFSHPSTCHFLSQGPNPLSLWSSPQQVPGDNSAEVLLIILAEVNEQHVGVCIGIRVTDFVSLSLAGLVKLPEVVLL